MCGIAGILAADPWTEAKHALHLSGENRIQIAAEHMVTSLEHRGPDAHGVQVANVGRPKVVLGNTRLAILDLSHAGSQPMPSADGRRWLTFNGEIYNFRELRRQLGSDWRSNSDTEVILRAYERWGRECLQHLRGMFAFALWDGARRELFIARDRLGIKPLYYTARDGLFLFGSEVRALLASGLASRRIDHIGLEQYLAYQCVPAPRTLVEDIQALPPGSWMVVDASGHMTEGRYWDMLENADPEATTATFAECCKRVRDLLREAVSLHMISDVPVGAFLSGGIDSSAVVALAHESGITPHTFSIGFAERGYDEARYAREIAARFRTDHAEIRVEERQLVEQIPDALKAMDQPTGDGVNTYLIARAVAEAGVKVALSGLGGDEVFAGYSSFSRLERVARLGHTWRHVPGSARRLAANLVRAAPASSIRGSKLAEMLESDGTLAGLYPSTRHVFTKEQRQALLQAHWSKPGAQAPEPYEALLRRAAARSPGLLNYVSYAEGRTYMHDLLLRDTDQMSMAHSLEVRVPLLDHKLVEYVMGVPDAFKRPNGTPKPLLTFALGDLLAPEIYRRPKQGFVLPLDRWMRGPLRTFCESRLEQGRIATRGLLQPMVVQGFWRDFLTDRPNVSWSRLWTLVALEEWLERHGF